MRVFCSGFNLYGQFIKYPSLTVDGFIDCHYDEITGLELGHTYAVVFKGNNIFLHGARDTKTHQIQKLKIPDTPNNVIQISCTDRRILFLNKNGVIFKLDLNNREKLAQLPYILPNECVNTNTDGFTKIACGSKINVALSRQGKLFHLPNKLHFENRNIVNICTGREHCIILDSNGNIYSFGRGSRGQLGHGNLEDEFEPKLVHGLAGIKIIKIAAGGWHSCAIGVDGDLYTWGWNGNGQLGLGKTNDEAVSIMAAPHVVDFDDISTKQSLDCVVVNIACGNRHTVALLDNGKLFGTGWNKYRQLGSINALNEDFYSMKYLHDFSELNVIDLKCGPWSTAVVID